MTDIENNTKDADHDEVQVVELTKQPIDLFKFLKFEGLVGSGGEAKAAIAQGHVILNDVVETQKRKKIVSGDIIEFGGVLYRMHCDEVVEPAKSKIIADEEKKSEVASAAMPAHKSRVNTNRKKATPSKAGRKAIGIKS